MTAFRDELLAVAARHRDVWLDRRFGLEDLADDGPALPPGCVPYLPSPVDVIVRVIELADVREPDVFVDIGCGVGRAAALVRLLTGASVVGIEVQPELAAAARDLAARLDVSRASFVVGDAADLDDAEVAAAFATGTVFFLYCPFGGERLERVLGRLETIAATRPIRVCCLDLPLPECPWLTPVTPLGGDLAIYRSAGTT